MSHTDFENASLIPSQRIAKVRDVGYAKVNRTIAALEASGQIQPYRTTTKRTWLNIGDARKVDLALCG